MDTNTFLLFIASLMFAGTNFYYNTKATQKNFVSVVMRYTFLFLGFVGLAAALTIILQSMGVL